MLTEILGAHHLHGGWIDHVFGYDAGGGYSFEALGSAPLAEGGTVEVGDEEVALSDHAAVIATIRIRPPGS